MKSQREIYEALLGGELITNLHGDIQKINDEGYQIRSSDKMATWRPFNECYTCPDEWQIYTPPVEPMKLEVEVEFMDVRETIAPIFLDATVRLTPFIGKRTKMTLVEILENENGK